jgi:hypothetical protein
MTFYESIKFDLTNSMERLASSKGRLRERDYHAENIYSHNRAHYGSDIFCRLHRLLCRGLTDPGE